MSTHHVFVNLEICPALLDVCTVHPPPMGGFAIADFEWSETDQAKLLALGEGATSAHVAEAARRHVGTTRDLCGQSRRTRRSALLWPQSCGESSLGRDAARVCQRHRNPSLVQELKLTAARASRPVITRFSESPTRRSGAARSGTPRGRAFRGKREGVPGTQSAQPGRMARRIALSVGLAVAVSLARAATGCSSRRATWPATRTPVRTPQVPTAAATRLRSSAMAASRRSVATRVACASPSMPARGLLRVANRAARRLGVRAVLQQRHRGVRPGRGRVVSRQHEQQLPRARLPTRLPRRVHRSILLRSPGCRDARRRRYPPGRWY